MYGYINLIVQNVITHNNREVYCILLRQEYKTG